MKTKISANNVFSYDRYGYAFEHAKERGGAGNHLDYGCYDGMFSNALMSEISNVFGVDVNKESIQKAKDLYKAQGLKFIHLENEKLDFPDNYFDSITMLDVLEHMAIEDQKNILIEFRRILKKGGKLIITVPKRHFFSFLDLGNWKFVFPRIHRLFYINKYGKEKYNDRYVLCKNGLIGDISVTKAWHEHFTCSKLISLCEECGLRNIDLDGSGFFMRVLIIISYFLPMRLSKLQHLDSKHFSSANLFATFTKS